MIPLLAEKELDSLISYANNVLPQLYFLTIDTNGPIIDGSGTVLLLSDVIKDKEWYMDRV